MRPHIHIRTAVLFSFLSSDHAPTHPPTISTPHQGLYVAPIQLAEPAANARIVYSPHVYGPSVYMQVRRWACFTTSIHTLMHQTHNTTPQNLQYHHGKKTKKTT